MSNHTPDVGKQLSRTLTEMDLPDDASAELGLEPDTPPDRTRQFRNTNLSRMKRSWTGDEAQIMMDLGHLAEQAIQARFGRALRVVERIREIAQVPATDDAGKVQYYSDGKVKPQLDDYGDPVEDYRRLKDSEISNFMFVIATHLTAWERARDRMWLEAMVSKVSWELAFADGFRNLPGAAISGKPTVDDRTQSGHAHSGQDRYFGVFMAALSREADSVVRSLNRVYKMLENMSNR